MKRQLILLLLLAGCGFQVKVSQEIKDLCKTAKDFEGCIKIQLKSQNSLKRKSKESEIEIKMKSLAKVIRSITPLEELSESSKSLKGLLNKSNEKDKLNLSYRTSEKAIDLLDQFSESMIKLRNAPAIYSHIYGKLHSCKKLEEIVKNFNIFVGSEAVKYTVYRKAPISGIHVCNGNALNYHERDMRYFIAGLLEDGSFNIKLNTKQENEYIESLKYLSKIKPSI